MPLRAWNGSAFTTAITARVWNGSSWVNAKSAKVWNGSSWVNFLSSVNIQDAADSGSDTNFDNASSSAGYVLYSGGGAETYNTSGAFTFPTTLTGQWLVGGSASDFSVRATITSQSGSGPGGTTGTFNTWLSLSFNREWTVFVSAAGNDVQEFENLTMTIDIAYTADTSKIIDTASIELSAIATTF
jgi:hypothetical protein